MRDHERRALLHLVLVTGFSRRNAEIAVEWFHAGKLTNQEWTVINNILLEPDPKEAYPSVKYRGSNPVMWVMDHLNYRITLAGGDAKTPSRIK
jgi:hypothetical protein